MKPAQLGLIAFAVIGISIAGYYSLGYSEKDTVVGESPQTEEELPKEIDWEAVNKKVAKIQADMDAGQEQLKNLKLQVTQTEVENPEIKRVQPLEITPQEKTAVSYELKEPIGQKSKDIETALKAAQAQTGMSEAELKALLEE